MEKEDVRVDEKNVEDVDAELEDGSEPSGEEDALQKLTLERDQLKEQLLRTMADFQNFRKRVQQEAESTKAFAKEQIVNSLLPVLDNFERTISAVEQGASQESLIEGVQAIDRQFRSILETLKVKRIEATGSHFDPEHHDAIAAESSDEHPEGVIISEVEAGYKMGEKVIRPARVRVSRGPGQK